MEQKTEQYQKLREYLRETKAENYPIQGHLLEKETDYNKNLYFKMLCMVLQYTDNIAEEQIFFLQRLTAGCHTEHSVQDYMRQALGAEPDDYKEFAEQAAGGDLRYTFVVDVLLASYLNACSDDYCGFIAELFESIGIKTRELAVLSRACRSILEQNSEGYEKSGTNRISEIPVSVYQPYLNLFFSGILLESRELLYYFSHDKVNRRTLEHCKTEMKNHCVIFENLKIRITDHNLNFIGCKKVRFQNCELTGDHNVLSFSSVGIAEFEDCTFTGFKNRVITADSSDHLKLTGCKFFDCGYIKEGTGDITGGVIAIERGTDSIAVVKCRFSNCFIKCTEYSRYCGVSGVILKCGRCENIILEDNEFIGCQNINNGNYTDALIYGSFNKIVVKNNVSTSKLRRLFDDYSESEYGCTPIDVI